MSCSQRKRKRFEKEVFLFVERWGEKSERMNEMIDTDDTHPFISSLACSRWRRHPWRLRLSTSWIVVNKESRERKKERKKNERKKERRRRRVEG